MLNITSIGVFCIDRMHSQRTVSVMKVCEFSILVHEKMTSTTHHIHYTHMGMDSFMNCLDMCLNQFTSDKFSIKIVENQYGADQFTTFDQFNWTLNHILKHVNDNHRSFQQSSSIDSSYRVRLALQFRWRKFLCIYYQWGPVPGEMKKSRYKNSEENVKKTKSTRVKCSREINSCIPIIRVKCKIRGAFSFFVGLRNIVSWDLYFVNYNFEHLTCLYNLCIDFYRFRFKCP